MHKATCITAALLLSGCEMIGYAPDLAFLEHARPPQGEAGPHTPNWAQPELPPTAPDTKRARWEQRLAEAKRDLVAARDIAVATQTPIAPTLEDQVTELLDRDLAAPDDVIRIERLQDAVADALRLAELVSIG
jgi:hypothetical protein